MDRNEVLSKLAPEQRAYVEKVDALLNDPNNREKLKAVKSVDEAIALMEDNGITFTETQKEEIRKKTAGLAATAETRELTPEDLGAVAGGWDWTNFFAVGGTGTVVGGIMGAAYVAAVMTGPVGWVVAAAVTGGTALATGGLLGTTAAVAEDIH